MLNRCVYHYCVCVCACTIQRVYVACMYVSMRSICACVYVRVYPTRVCGMYVCIYAQHMCMCVCACTIQCLFVCVYAYGMYVCIYAQHMCVCVCAGSIQRVYVACMYVSMRSICACVYVRAQSNACLCMLCIWHVCMYLCAAHVRVYLCGFYPMLVCVGYVYGIFVSMRSTCCCICVGALSNVCVCVLSAWHPCVCVCVCVCGRSLFVYIVLYLRAHAMLSQTPPILIDSMCVCVCAFTPPIFIDSMYVCLCVRIYCVHIYFPKRHLFSLAVCVCMCVCARLLCALCSLDQPPVRLCAQWPRGAPIPSAACCLSSSGITHSGSISDESLCQSDRHTQRPWNTLGGRDCHSPIPPSRWGAT